MAAVAVLATLGAVAGTAYVAAGTSDQAEVEGDGGGVEYDVGVAEGRVAPEDLWAQTVEALKCAEAAGAPSFGPYPKADGLGLGYTIRVVDAETSKAVDTCIARALPAARRFELDNQRVREQPPTADSRRLLRYGDALGACLGGTPEKDGRADDPLGDAGFESVAMMRPEAFHACARAAG